MSFWGGFKTFFEKVGAEIEKLFGSKATFEQTVSAVITYAAPLLETIITLAAGQPAEAIAASVIAKVQADLATVSSLVQDATVAAGSSTETAISTALTSVETNLNTLVADAGVKSSTTAAKIESTVNLVIGETQAVLKNLPSLAATAPSAPVVPAAS